VLHGDDEEEVLTVVVDHAGQAHPDLRLTPETAAAVRSAIHPE
jgi:predicted small metal-binding protein